MTSVDARLLEVRKVMKRRKPNFKIQNSNDPKKRFAGRWKRPKGLQSKMRERRKGNPRYIEPGYGSPAAVRGATPEGLFPVVVSNLGDFAKVEAGGGVIISASAGMRRKAELLKEIGVRKLRLLNFNADELSKRISESVALRKKTRAGILHKRKSKAQEKLKGAGKGAEKAAPAGQGDIESKLSDDDRKKAEKAEKDKLLTKAK